VGLHHRVGHHVGHLVICSYGAGRFAPLVTPMTWMLFTSPLVPLDRMPTNGGSWPVGPEPLLHLVGERREVVGRDLVRPHAADVVQRVARPQRDRPVAVGGRPDGDERHLRVGRAGRLDDVRVAGPGVHLHPVVPPSGLSSSTPGLHLVPAVEQRPRLGADAPPDLRRLEVAERPADAVGDPPGDERLVVAELAVRLRRVRPPRARGRVRVGGRHQQVLGRQAGLGGDQPLGLVVHLRLMPTLSHTTTASFVVAVVQHEAAGVQLVVDPLGLRLGKVADDLAPQHRA
jgi:hypothetical protein